MQCPVCQSELKRILYESVPVFHCLQCHGYLLGEHRLEGIENSPATPIEQLKREVIAEARPDTKEAIRCPRCRRKMKKRFVEEPAALYVDVCAECRHVWLDGGELGRLQLTREMTPQAQEARQFRRRLETMTADERADLEANLEKLPKGDGSLQVLIGMLFGRQHDGLA